jgi:hypothetical protein
MHLARIPERELSLVGSGSFCCTDAENEIEEQRPFEEEAETNREKSERSAKELIAQPAGCYLTTGRFNSSVSLAMPSFL